MWPLTDALGSVYALTDLSGAIVRNQNFEVYGERTSSTGTGPTTSRGFTGRWHDGNGLVESRDRQRNPKLGGWLTADRRGMVDGANRYAYVNARPTQATDPSGAQLTTYTGPTIPMYRQLAVGALKMADLFGNGPVMDQYLTRMQGLGYSLSFFNVFDGVVGLGRIEFNFIGITWNKEGHTFPAEGCFLHQGFPTAVIDPANTLSLAADLAQQGKSTSVEETIAHELGHIKELSILGEHYADPDFDPMWSCDEMKKMHILMYGGDLISAERTWPGCKHL